MEEEKMFSKKWTSLFALVMIVSMVLSACAAPPPVVIEKPVIQTVVVEKEVVVEKPVVQTVVVEKPVIQTVEVVRKKVEETVTPKAYYPPIDLGVIGPREDNTVPFSWSWVQDDRRLDGVKFRIVIWVEGKLLPVANETPRYFFYWLPETWLQPGEKIMWQVEAWKEGELLAQSPVGSFLLPEPEAVTTPTPTSTPVIQTVVVEKEVTVVVERDVVVTATPAPEPITGSISVSLMDPNGSPWGGDPDPLELRIHRGDEPIERLEIDETYTGIPGKVEVEIWANPGFWSKYWIDQNHVRVKVEADQTVQVRFVLGRIETKPTPGPTREPTPTTTPPPPRPGTPTPTPTPR